MEKQTPGLEEKNARIVFIMKDVWWRKYIPDPGLYVLIAYGAKLGKVSEVNDNQH